MVLRLKLQGLKWWNTHSCRNFLHDQALHCSRAVTPFPGLCWICLGNVWIVEPNNIECTYIHTYVFNPQACCHCHHPPPFDSYGGGVRCLTKWHISHVCQQWLAHIIQASWMWRSPQIPVGLWDAELPPSLLSLRQLFWWCLHQLCQQQFSCR